MELGWANIMSKMFFKPKKKQTPPFEGMDWIYFKLAEFLVLLAEHCSEDLATLARSFAANISQFCPPSCNKPSSNRTGTWPWCCRIYRPFMLFFVVAYFEMLGLKAIVAYFLALGPKVGFKAMILSFNFGYIPVWPIFSVIGQISKWHYSYLWKFITSQFLP